MRRSDVAYARVRSAVSILAALLPLTGCGARTGPVDELALTATDTGISADTSVTDTLGDDTTVSLDATGETGADTAVPIDARACGSDVDCDDLLACTDDSCDPSVGRCVHVAVDARCDDGLFCDGTERCDLFVGCVAGALDCADAVSCTHDVCDETGRRCTHAPDDTLCPISHGCDPVLGCQARALAQTARDLFEIRLPSGVIRRIGATGITLNDIALSPFGVLVGVNYSSLSTVDTTTGIAKPYASVSIAFNALDYAEDHSLFGAGGNTVYAIGAAPAFTVTRFATFPPGLSSSGDLAFLGPRLLATANASTTSNDLLLELDFATSTFKTLGSVGHRCVWGLAAFGPTLYGLTCEGKILSIDPATGAGTLLTTVGESFYGASAR